MTADLHRLAASINKLAGLDSPDFLTMFREVGLREDIDLAGMDLSGLDLRAADLAGCDLSQADLRGTDLTLADLSSASLRQADLRGARLIGVDLNASQIQGRGGLVDDSTVFSILARDLPRSQPILISDQPDGAEARLGAPAESAACTLAEAATILGQGSDRVVIVALTSGHVLARQIGGLRRAYPTNAFIALVTARLPESEAIDLALAAPDATVSNDGPEWGRAVIRARANACARAVEDELWSLPSLAGSVLGRCISMAIAPTSIAAIARECGYSHTTLARFLRDAGLPTLRRFAVWGKQILAGHLKRTTRMGLVELADAVGYASPMSLIRSRKALLADSAHSAAEDRFPDVADFLRMEMRISGRLGKRGPATSDRSYRRQVLVRLASLAAG